MMWVVLDDAQYDKYLQKRRLTTPHKKYLRKDSLLVLRVSGPNFCPFSTSSREVSFSVNPFTQRATGWGHLGYAAEPSIDVITFRPVNPALLWKS
jgi:hypothetical protein